jgi:hypothetical protein
MQTKPAIMPKTDLNQYMISKVFMISCAFSSNILNSDLKLPMPHRIPQNKHIKAHTQFFQQQFRTIGFLTI